LFSVYIGTDLFADIKLLCNSDRFDNSVPISRPKPSPHTLFASSLSLPVPSFPFSNLLSPLPVQPGRRNRLLPLQLLFQLPNILRNRTRHVDSRRRRWVFEARLRSRRRRCIGSVGHTLCHRAGEVALRQRRGVRCGADFGAAEVEGAFLDGRDGGGAGRGAEGRGVHV
jgi:hypothetical protein